MCLLGTLLNNTGGVIDQFRRFFGRKLHLLLLTLHIRDVGLHFCSFFLLIVGRLIGDLRDIRKLFGRISKGMGSVLHLLQAV
ncbi:Uncharacterised protein [Vibrio cholerae]|uniref:Uncharacterized protein n=1 Tax=Vibrio cholerae TaxID=666 RepID=A0A655ZFF0_VIBCL|nr:Uncharacterised protein [Vibrio cholerae]CSB64819.1 Uncharacterised protein [Vibrio cholerae]CSC66866.1 Uncharacterised protein [Vibrio cholerae]